ncbi:MAG: 4Fe-4S cluster-binding domain-containing protein [Candidatus Omnitrophota bacterium]
MRAYKNRFRAVLRIADIVLLTLLLPGLALPSAGIDANIDRTCLAAQNISGPIVDAVGVENLRQVRLELRALTSMACRNLRNRLDPASAETCYFSRLDLNSKLEELYSHTTDGKPLIDVSTEPEINTGAGTIEIAVRTSTPAPRYFRIIISGTSVEDVFDNGLINITEESFDPAPAARQTEAQILTERDRLVDTLSYDFASHPPASLYGKRYKTLVYLPTLNCPLGCEGCIYASKFSKERARLEAAQTAPIIDRLIEITYNHEFDMLILTGGGEPLFARDSCLRLIRHARVKRIMMATNSYWAQSPHKARQMLNALHKAASKNKHLETLHLRLSVDILHQDKLSLENIRNIIDAATRPRLFRKKPRYPKILVGISGLKAVRANGENPVDTLLNTYYPGTTVLSQKTMGPNLRNDIRLPNGYTMILFFAPLTVMNHFTPHDITYDRFDTQMLIDDYMGILGHTSNTPLIIDTLGETRFAGEYGAHMAISLGNILTNSPEQIQARQWQDPFVRAVHSEKEGPPRIIALASEVIPDFAARVERYNAVRGTWHAVLENAPLLLYVTKRLIQEDIRAGKLKPTGTLKAIADTSQDSLKRQYYVRAERVKHEKSEVTKQDITPSDISLWGNKMLLDRISEQIPGCPIDMAIRTSLIPDDKTDFYIAMWAEIILGHMKRGYDIHYLFEKQGPEGYDDRIKQGIIEAISKSASEFGIQPRGIADRINIKHKKTDTPIFNISIMGKGSLENVESSDDLTYHVAMQDSAGYANPVLIHDFLSSSTIGLVQVACARARMRDTATPGAPGQPTSLDETVDMLLPRLRDIYARIFPGQDIRECVTRNTLLNMIHTDFRIRRALALSLALTPIQRADIEHISKYHRTVIQLLRFA